VLGSKCLQVNANAGQKLISSMIDQLLVDRNFKQKTAFVILLPLAGTIKDYDHPYHSLAPALQETARQLF
jgi:hypothetical protein